MKNLPQALAELDDITVYDNSSTIGTGPELILEVVDRQPVYLVDRATGLADRCSPRHRLSIGLHPPPVRSRLVFLTTLKPHSGTGPAPVLNVVNDGKGPPVSVTAGLAAAHV